MNETFKTELTTLAMDLREMCRSHLLCSKCELWRDGHCAAKMSSVAFDYEATLAAVEAYRKHKKSRKEVIDHAMDVYTLEVRIEKRYRDCSSTDVKMASEIFKHYMETDYNCSVSVLSAERVVLGSHVEDAD